MDILLNLNNEQMEAVTETEGFVRVAAGAGSGKTRALSHRFAYLVEGIGISPANILCVTFTNKAANEMHKRIRRLIGDHDTGYIGTFHSFCVVILKEDINIVRYPKSFIVLDIEDSYTILKTVYTERGLTLRDMTFRKAKDMIEIIKNAEYPEYYKDLIYLSIDELKRKYDNAIETRDIIFWGYLYEQKKCFGLDFDDLIYFTMHIFRISEETKIKWQTRLEYIMVDEFQDIDGVQYEFVSILCGYHNNLFIVGDPDQTIYTWRGANVNFFLNFDKDFNPCKSITMDYNYRSTPEILAAANSLIDKNKNRLPKTLRTDKPSGAPVIYNHSETAEREAEFIAEEILRLQENDIALNDIVILYRAHYLSRVIEEVFIKKEIKYVIYSGVEFYNRKEIKDILSYLRMLVYRDDLSFSRIVNEPKRNIGERRMDFLKTFAEEHGCTLYSALSENLHENIFKGTLAADFIMLIEKFTALSNEMSLTNLLTAMLQESGYEEMLRTSGDHNRLDNLAELKQAIYDYETTCGEDFSLDDYFSKVALMTGADKEDKSNSVKMMTVHTAKGLEFKNVFIIGLSEGIFPSKLSNTIEKMEEERRLAYVALTRAEERLYLTDSEGTNFDGSFRYPSRFILNIDRNLLKYNIELDQRIVDDARIRIEQSERMLRFDADGIRFEIGERVVHPIMGAGTIQDFNAETSCYQVMFDMSKTPRNINIKIRMEKEK